MGEISPGRGFPCSATTADGKFQATTGSAVCGRSAGLWELSVMKPLMGKAVREFLGTHVVQWKLLVTIVLCMGTVALLQVPGPLFTMHIIDGAGSGRYSASRIAALCGALAVVVFGGILVQLLQSVAIEKLRYRITFPLQTRLFGHCLQLPITEHARHPHGYLMARLREDPGLLQSLTADSLLRLLSDFITLAVGIVLLFHVHRKMALISVVVLPPLIVLFVAVRTKLRGDFAELQEGSALVNEHIADVLASIYSIKSFTLEQEVTHQYVRNNARQVRQRLVIWRKRILYQTVIAALTGIVPVILLLYGAIEISHGRLTAGQYIAFGGYLGYLYRPTENIVITLLSFQNYVSAAQRIFDIFVTTPELREYTVLGDLPEGGPNVALEFRDVTFRYPGQQQATLSGISFCLEYGSVMAVIGASGAGKTTLANLVPRLLEPCEGNIFLMGKHQRSFELTALRQRAVIVSPETRLFPTTVFDNIQCGNRHATFDEVRKAAHLACADEFIELLPDKYRTRLGELGHGLSAGQRQRLLIARAIIRNPEVLILDEATGLLDLAKEQALVTRLRLWLDQRSLIVISHRPSLSRIADSALYLYGGRCRRIEVGSYTDSSASIP